MQEPQYTVKLDQNEISCKNCGARLRFKPGTAHLTCHNCQTDNEITIKAAEIEEIDYLQFISQQSDVAPKQEVKTLKCDACGAETTFDPKTVSSECAFCTTPLVVKNATTSNILRPKSLLPFAIDEKRGQEMFRTWISKLWWAPNNLKSYARQTEKLNGMYLPYWTYDANTTSDYTGERGDDYQTTETYTNSKGETETRTVTKTRWYPVSGRVHVDFDDVLVVASQSLPEKYVDRLEPWDLQNMAAFDEKFLAGFKAESYQIDVKQGFERAKDKMEAIIRNAVCSDIGGDHQRIHSLEVHHRDITFKHILLPVWLSAYKYGEKIFRFMINGRTGEVQGERPYSWIKITLAVIAGLAVVGAIWYFSSQQ